MKYLCLIYVDENELDETDPEVLQAVSGDCDRYSDELERHGQLIACERLEPVRTAVSIRTRSGKVSTTDGPFAETKEQLAGFYLVDAADMEEALRIAARIPPGRFGCVEVRPVRGESSL